MLLEIREVEEHEKERAGSGLRLSCNVRLAKKKGSESVKQSKVEREERGVKEGNQNPFIFLAKNP